MPRVDLRNSSLCNRRRWLLFDSCFVEKGVLGERDEDLCLIKSPQISVVLLFQGIIYFLKGQNTLDGVV